eukprot:s2142_g8.t2
MPPPSDSELPKSVRDYVLGGTLATGGYGRVVLATHSATGEKAAVKVMMKSEKNETEVAILKQVQIPHIVRCLEFVQLQDYDFLVMEFASGGDMFDYLSGKGHIKEPEACHFFHQLMAGVEQVHSMDVVHRDIKLENLLLDGRRNVKIADFGCSTRFRRGQTFTERCGTLNYVAPEMIAGDGYVPPQCDLWSCGVALFLLLCGNFPFEEARKRALFRKILMADYKTPKYISESAADLIANLLKTDPELRFDVPAVRAHTWYRQIPQASLRHDG